MARKHPGITKLPNGRYRIRTTVVDPRTGKQKEKERIVEATSYAHAASQRALLRLAIHDKVEAAPRLTVGDFAESWLTGKRCELADSTLETYATALDQMEWLCDLYIDQVVPADILKWRSERTGRPATVNGYLRVVKTMFADAKSQLRLDHDPVERVSGVRDKRSREEKDSNRLTADELGRVLTKARELQPQWHALFAALALTGARWGAVSALRWSDVDLTKGEIVFRRAQWRGELKELKTDQIRRVPITAMLIDVLTSQRQYQLKKQDQLQLASGLVFPSKNGKLLRNGGGVHRPWRAVLDAAEIDRHVTIKGLRKTFNNLCRQVSSTMVTQALTGHVTDEMTEHYAYIEEAEKRDAVVRIARLITPTGSDVGD